MKKILSVVLGALCCSIMSAKTQPSPLDAEAYVIVHAQPGQNFVSLGASAGKAVVGEFKGAGNIMRPVVRYSYRCKSTNWETVSFKFKSEFNGFAELSLSGLHRYKNGQKEMLLVNYDDVKINGKLVQNGDFSDGLMGWSGRRAYPTKVLSENVGGAENKFLQAWSGSYMTRSVEMKKGEVYEISFRVRPVGLVNVKQGEFSIDLSKFYNYDISDFSKFGTKMNLSKLGLGKKSFEDITFNLADKNGKNGVLFNSNKLATGLKNIKFDVNGLGRNLYLLHTGFYSGSNNKNVGKIKIAMGDGTVREIPLVRGNDVWIFNDSRRIDVNALSVYQVNPEKRIGNVFLSKFKIVDEDIIKSVEIETSGEDAILLLGATISQKDVPTIKIKKFDPSEWVVADIPEILNVKEGSALDQSVFFDPAPAGAYGRVILTDRGTLAFEKTPQKDARFKGFSEYSIPYFAKMAPDVRAVKIKEYAKQFKKSGYNFARISFETLKEYYPTEEERAKVYDVADRLISELKNEGVYIHLTLVWYRMGLKGYHFNIRDDVKLRAVFGDENVRNHWKATAEYQLNHINPYTGLAWKDDPVFVCAEYYNELAICFSRMDRSTKFDPRDEILPETEKLVLSKWRAWLKNRYKGDISALNKSWTEMFNDGRKFEYKNFDEVPCIVKRNSDWERCCWDHLADFVAFAEKVVDGTGYKGLKVQNNLGTVPYGVGVRASTTDYSIMNSYYSHPSSFNMNNATCPQGDAINGLAGYWRGIAATKLNNRPMFVTEYNHCFWNKSRYQFPAMFAPYSAYQNFSGLTIHSDAIQYRDTPYKTVSAFSVVQSPVARVSELFSCATFIRGDVTPAKHRVDMNLSQDFLNNSPMALRGFSTFQTEALLLLGYANNVEDVKIPAKVKRVKVKPADVVMNPKGSSEIIAEAWFHGVADSKDKMFDTGKFIDVLRQKNILSKDNISDAKKGVYQSDTKQLTLYKEKKMLKVVTPRSEIVAMANPEEVRLGALKVVSSTVPASVGVCSLDGKDIPDSSRLMFVYATKEGNYGMKLSLDDRISVGMGRGPIVVQKGAVEAEVRLSPNSKYEIYAVNLNGERREKIPFNFVDGVLKFKIDNSKLKNGATPFFEIVRL